MHGAVEKLLVVTS